MNKRTRKQYFDLIRELSLTDFKLKYEGSVLGYVWSFAKPLLLFGVLFVVFTVVFKLGNSIPHYAVYLLLGVVLWIYFADATATAMTSIVDRQELIRKIYFPRSILVIATSATSLITLALNLLVLGIFMTIIGIRPGLNAVLFPVLVVELYVLALGCSLLLAGFYVRFRDFRHIWEVVLQVLFYATPIIYPINIVGGQWRQVLLLNPLAQILQDARYLLITPSAIRSEDAIHLPLVLLPYSLPVVVVAIGLWYFRAAARHFAELV